MAQDLMYVLEQADISNRHFRQGDDFDELNRVSKGIADILIKNKRV